MFAVPGWAVSSSSLAKQTSDHSAGHPPLQTPDGEGTTSGQKRHRKRKRGPKSPPGVTIDGENLASLWERFIEGKDNREDPGKPGRPSSSTEQQKRKQPRGKEDGQGAAKAATAKEDGPEAEASQPGTSSKERFEKRKKLKEEKRAAKAHMQTTGEMPPERPPPTPSQLPATTTKDPKPQLTPLQAAMRQKLTAARFRHLNQTLYTTPSTHAHELFQQNPEMFEEYHEGFRRQVEVWPENPVDGYIAELKLRGRNKTSSNPKLKSKHALSTANPGPTVPPLPRTGRICTVADLGCGDAKLAQAMRDTKKKLKLELCSFDLQSRHPLVTLADIANLPLRDGGVDIAIFCLALMGTNWLEFIDEAFRVLRWKGELWIAEIKSRFMRPDPKKGTDTNAPATKKNKKKKQKIIPAPNQADDEPNDEDTLAVEVDGQEDADTAQETYAPFIAVLQKRGFVLSSSSPNGPAGPPHSTDPPAAIDTSNKMFVKLTFMKLTTPTRGKNVPTSSAAASAGGGMGGAGTRMTHLKPPKHSRLKFSGLHDGAGAGAGDGTDAELARDAAVLKPCVYKLR
ncbi:MAG: 25S rRNA (adenine645-N1)-methyltransferase [Thelocarpon superellum]|nr:MAG: 25S rRNA (adenine645-N1)-methyltransferase [Thelocarpon superellum]